MTIHRLFFSSILLGLIGFGIWTALLSYRPTTFSDTILASLPDGYMEDVNALILDQDGHPKMKILSPRMVHYAEQDTTKLTSPHLTIYRKSPRPWYVTSRVAKATQGIDTVEFWRNVVIHHAEDTAHPETLIKTETLTVHTNDDTAETKDFITLTQPRLIIRAIGMFADMGKGEVKLLSNVRGVYEPS